VAEFKIVRDFSAAIRKTQALKAVPRAFKRVITGWAAETVQVLKRSATDMKKSGPGRKTGQLARSVGMEISAAEEAYKVTVGTGVGRGLASKYARIQDEGGTIHKKDKMLTIPLPGVKGTIRNFPGGFFFKSKAGNVLYVMPRWKKVRGGENSKSAGFTPLFVLKDQVTLPATMWFTGPMRTRLEYLEEAARPENVLKVAQMIAET
jgi:hypothetical protein